MHISKSATRFTKFTRGPFVFHNSMRNKQLELNPYIHALSKLFTREKKNEKKTKMYI